MTAVLLVPKWRAVRWEPGGGEGGAEGSGRGGARVGGGGRRMVTRRRTTERLGKAVASRSGDGSVGTAWREGVACGVVMPAWVWVSLASDRHHTGLCLASPEVSCVGSDFFCGVGDFGQVAGVTCCWTGVCYSDGPRTPCG